MVRSQPGRIPRELSVASGHCPVGEAGDPRPNVRARLAMLRTALGDQAEGDDDDPQVLLRTVLPLTSPVAWLYWKDYLGLKSLGGGMPPRR